MLADPASAVLDPSVVVVLVTTAGALFMFAVGLFKDHSSSTTARQLSKEITAHRHYENDLIAWGAHSTEEPPRTPPDPPDILMKD
jgi:hypothetical protein